MISVAFLLISSLTFSSMALEHKPSQMFLEANATKAVAGRFNRIGDVCLGDEIGGAEGMASLGSLNAVAMFNECKRNCERNGGCIAFNVAYDDAVGKAQQAVCYEYKTIVGSELYGDLYINKRHLKDNKFGPHEPVLGCYIQVNQGC
eukprot:jgi/Bigna1/91477/estExt_fgenesh1_pg.C_1020034